MTLFIFQFFMQINICTSLESSGISVLLQVGHAFIHLKEREQILFTTLINEEIELA
jgi:hypothetical protein